MRKEEWKDFFHFTRKETTGILALLILMVLIFCLPALIAYFSPPMPEIISTEDDRIVKGFKAKESESTYAKYDRGEASQHEYNKEEEPQPIVNPFVFDPNLLDEQGWLSLGLSKKTVKTIRNYLSKGGKFRKPDDINRIYGISPSLAAKLIPYVSIPNSNKFEKLHYDSSAFSVTKFEKKAISGKRESAGPLDINKADSLDWLALDGIGPSLTSRILKFRNKLGGFYAVGQIAEVFGLPDSTFQQLKPLLLCTPAVIKKIQLNAATPEELEQHPYIRKKLAKVILAYREQHGPFRSLSDLERIQLIDPALLTKLVPYLSVE